MKKNLSFTHTFLSMLLMALAAASPTYADSITVQVDKPGVKMSPTFYGLMTEEINHSYDGGLYGELIRNRIFKDDARHPTGWSVVKADGAAASIVLDTAVPLNDRLDTSLRLDVSTASDALRAGVANSGYWGIPIKPETHYEASFYAKAARGFDGPVTVSLESSDGATVYATAKVERLTAEWKRYSLTLDTGSVTPTTAARFVVSVNHPGTVWLDLVSLFPPTFNHRPNGNRVDLMEILGGMKPSFLRLPGGNYVEGDTIATRFDWKKTIGPLEQRPGHPGTWSYRSSDGMGLLEFLEWCEDLKMQPVLAVWAGYALRGEHIDAGPELTPYVEEALEEIEYVTGDTSTKWGAARAKDGHPAPFPLTYVEIGNEDTFDRSGSYNGRFAQFYDAIKAKYPSLQLIATMPVTSRKPDVVDDHYYRSARQMEADLHYDSQSRNGPKIFVGEWATTEGSPTPTLNAALGDAAWLIDLERNSDLIVMEAYAPLLVNVNPGARQWATDLIGYDALHSFGSPSYYVQAMFANNHGERVLPVKMVTEQSIPLAESFVPKGGIGVGTWNTRAEFKDLKVTHNGETLFQTTFADGLQGWRRAGGEWTTKDGVLIQSAGTENIHATTGDRNWKDYTYELKARKTEGAEGFLVLFHVSNPKDYIWFNVGGWNNIRTAMEKAENGAKAEIGNAATNTVETGRWYDVKIEVEGRAIRCYLDGALVCQATDEPAPQPAPIYANATSDPATGDVFLHVANVSAQARPVEFSLEGVTSVAGTATCQEMSGDPSDVNTIEEPRKVAPKTTQLSGIGATFTHELPAHSVSVIKLNAR
ncbi:MAG: alpha-L-arabinofuranosidase C-terminal domain-containing protein [Limisphaerales bacterium]